MATGPNPYDAPDADDQMAVRHDASTALAAARISAGLHALAWGVLLLVLLFVVPRFTRTFEDFGSALPQFSVLVIKASMLAIAYWYAFLLLGLIATAADWAVLFWLSSNKQKTIRRLWSILMLTLPLVLIAAVILGVALPTIQLVEELS